MGHRRERAAEIRALDVLWSTQCRRPTAEGRGGGFGLAHVCPSVLQPYLRAAVVASHREEKGPASPSSSLEYSPSGVLETWGRFAPSRLSNTFSPYFRDAFFSPATKHPHSSSNTRIPSPHCLLFLFISQAPLPLASISWAFQMSLIDLKTLLFQLSLSYRQAYRTLTCVCVTPGSQHEEISLVSLSLLKPKDLGSDDKDKRPLR